jgi:hypothetical protein
MSKKSSKLLDTTSLTNPSTEQVNAAVNNDQLTNPSTKKVKAAVAKQAEAEEKKVTPITVGNPRTVKSLIIDQSHLEEFVNLEEQSDEVRCQKPPKGIFFTVLSEKSEDPSGWENRAFVFLLEIEGRDPYLVAPEVARQRADEDVIRPILLVRFVTMSGEEGLWPLKLDQPDAKSNSWNKSALNILKEAESGKWVRIVSAKKFYRKQVSKKTFDECPPKFSKRPFPELIGSAFDKDHQVFDIDHEVWDILDNGSLE